MLRFAPVVRSSISIFRLAGAVLCTSPVYRFGLSVCPARISNRPPCMRLASLDTSDLSASVEYRSPCRRLRDPQYIAHDHNTGRNIMTCTTTKACAAWAVAIVALTRLPSLDGFSPLAAAAAASRSTLSWGVSGGSRHSNDRQSGRTVSPVPFISHSNKYASFFQLRASRDELESMAVKDLRQTATDLGLPATGLNKMRKAELVEFLLQADEGESAVDEPVPIQATDLLGVAEEEESDADASSADFKEDVVSPGVKTLREFLTYSDYGIRKLQDQRQRGEAIRADIGDGKRDMPAYYFEDFVEEEEDREDDPNVIIADEWGSWDERDLAGPPMAGDWDPENDPNPNDLDPEFEYVTEIPKNEEGVEEGYDPMFGSWCKCCCCFS